MLPGILIGLTVHEYCHALCAWKLGDSTAHEQGRVTLNPLKHIDLIGFLFIIILGFGWAKPVEFSPGNLRNFRRDKAVIAAAGPLSNFILGIIFIFCIKAMIPNISGFGFFQENLFNIIFYAASINFGLFIFNLIPIPPLDGSHIIFSCLNLHPDAEDRIRRFGMPLLIVILIIQNYTDVSIIPIGKMIGAIINFFL